MRLTVDPTRCTGHARCIATAPDLFAFDSDEERSSPKLPVVPDDRIEDARRAVAGCPEGAIRLDQ